MSKTGVVENVCDYFTRVRFADGEGALFSHQGQNAAPEALRKVGMKVVATRGDPDPIWHLAEAPAEKKVPMRRRA